MIGDVLDWDAGFHLMCLIVRQVMGLRPSKGGTAPPESADPLGGRPDQEGDCLLDPPVTAQNNVSTERQPVASSVLPKDPSLEGLDKDTSETSPVTEDLSFASCLTEEPDSLSQSSPSDKNLAPDQSKDTGQSLDLSLNSDSEYESAEELEPPPKPSSVDTQPPPDTAEPRAAVPEQTQTAKQDETKSAAGVEETSKLVINGEQKDIQVEGSSTVISQPEQPTYSAISESLVTITKQEIIEESVCEKSVVSPEQIVVTLSKSETNEPVIPDDLVQKNTNIHVYEKPVCVVERKDNSDLSRDSRESNPILSCDSVPEVQADSVELKVNENEDQDNANHLGNEKVLTEEPITVSDTVEREQNSSVHLPPVENHIDSCDTVEDTPLKQPVLEAEPNPEDLPIPPSKGYNLDFLDSIDDPNFNPFATKTVVRVTPPPSPKAGVKLPPLKPAVKKKKGTKQPERKAPIGNSCEPEQRDSSKPIARVEEKIEEPLKQEQVTASERVETSVTNSVTEATTENNANLKNTGQVLEISLEDTNKTLSKPPRKLRGKPQLKEKQPATKSVEKSEVLEKNNNRINEKIINETAVKSEEPGDEENEPIPPSKGYNLDFLDQLDDPNFNPFQTKSYLSSSPPKEGLETPNKQEHISEPKAKVVTAKKASPRKGFAAIKKKGKANFSEVSEQNKSGEINHEKVETDPKKSEDEGKQEEEEEPRLPDKGYNLDFLDDPSFNPFQTRSNLENNNAGISSAKTPTKTCDAPVAPKGVTAVSEADSTQEESKSNNNNNNNNLCEPLVEGKASKESIAIENNKSLTSRDKEEVPERPPVQNSIEESESVAKEYKQTETKPQTVGSEIEVADFKPAAVVKDIKSEVSETNCDVDCSRLDGKEVHSKVSEIKVETPLNTVQTQEVAPTVIDTPCILEKQLDTQKLQTDVRLKSDSESIAQTENTASESDVFKELGINKIPSIGKIGQLDSLEFAQLLGNEASRLAEEFMNCSTDSGLPDSDDNSCIKSGSLNSSMADTDCNKPSQYGTHLDENVNPFQKNSRIQRSPPLGKRGAVCGAESVDADAMNTFQIRRSLKRESVMGEERLPSTSIDDDSGIALATRSDLETEVNMSEAGPEIATGLTSSDLKCASQFFKEASDMENQLRKCLASPLMGSQSKLSGDEVTPTKDKPQQSGFASESPQHKRVPSTSSPAPPREERSAPEGTSSPTPRPTDTSERKPSSVRPTSAPPEGYMTAAEVQELLKRQEVQFKEKLKRTELEAVEKEKKLRQAMKDEQKEMSNLGGTVSELAQSRDALLKMVGQYKGMLASLVSEKEKEKQNYEERIKSLETERTQALEDLANVEAAFSDVHRKYERTKQVVDTLRRNEETLRGAVADYEAKLQKQEEKFVQFQKHAEEKIQQANEEFETMRRANEQEMTKMAALLKKAEMKIVSLQESNDRKTRENQELTQLCDDLINKVGNAH